MPGAGSAGIEDHLLEGQWLSADYKIGDVLFFHSRTVHMSLPNRTGNRMRISVDYRYQGLSQPIHPKCLRPHLRQFDWDYVYAGWQSKAFQYYWKDLPLEIEEE